MAESSITHNFIITDQDEIERFAKILEESANDPPRPCPYKFRLLEDPDEIRECILKVNRTNAQRELARNCVANTSEHAAQASSE